MLLTYGSQGGDVTALQKKLNESGYGLAEDGIYGSRTRAAVTDYQAKNGLQVDGIAGDETWSSLFAAPSAEPAPSEPAAPEPSEPTAAETAAAEAAADLAAAKAAAPAAEDSPWQRRMDEIFETLAARKPFAYDPEGDPLYRGYRTALLREGRAAMEDAAGRAAALTGGYGSTYAETAGAEQYGKYLSKLSEALPQYAAAASRRDAAEVSALESSYARASAASEADYARYRDRVADYTASVNRAQTRYDAAVKADAAEKTAAKTASDKAAAAARSEKRAEALRLLTAGVLPTDEELSAAGLTRAYAQRLAAAHKK